MQHSKIASNLKTKIDDEMNKFKSNNSLVTFDEQILNTNNKSDLLNIKNQLISLQKNELVPEQELKQTKHKIRILLKDAGFIDFVTFFIIFGFIIVLGIGIGFILYK